MMPEGNRHLHYGMQETVNSYNECKYNKHFSV